MENLSGITDTDGSMYESKMPGFAVNTKVQSGENYPYIDTYNSGNRSGMDNRCVKPE
ncbi:MAG: hypothetical protein STSR0009_11230 [Methanoregula sp.]